jgi:phospholipid-binding lipoprotein MlaA
MARYRHRLALCALCTGLAVPLAALAGTPQSVVDVPRGSPGSAPEPTPAPEVELLDYDPLFDDEFDQPEVSDPLETSNRAIYGFNRKVSRIMWDPITTGYRFVVPAPARRAVRRVFNNLNAPIYIANHLVQLHPLVAAETLGALTMNATFGVGGLFDTASGVGFELNPTDFGQTLAVAGVGTGPYLMIPFLGPTTLRDGIGFVVDRAFHPATYFFALPIQLVGYGGVGFAALEAAHDDLKALEDSALDPYAVLRSAYIQARESAIEELGGLGRDAAPQAEAGASLASDARRY